MPVAHEPKRLSEDPYRVGQERVDHPAQWEDPHRNTEETDAFMAVYYNNANADFEAGRAWLRSGTLILPRFSISTGVNTRSGAYGAGPRAIPLWLLRHFPGQGSHAKIKG